MPRWLAPWKLWSFIERLTGRRRILQAHVNTVRGYVGTIVKQHRHLLAHSSPAAATAAAGRAEQAQVNLLSQLMLARGEDGQPLPEEELVDHMIAFIVAGKDTSALVRDQWIDRSRGSQPLQTTHHASVIRAVWRRR